MQCKYCQKEVYIAHICPYCKEFYCIEHREPASHNCQVYQQFSIGLPKPIQVRKPPTKEYAELKLHYPKVLNLQKKLFMLTFTLVIIEEILRLISYPQRSPYIDGNIYVTLLSQLITPYLASIIFLLTTCTILFITKRLSEKSKPKNELSALITTAAPISVYIAILIIYAYSIANWLLIITP
jgi:hypothetical protein